MAHNDKGLLLHVGLPKTGTTTLQRALFANHSQLFYLGKYDRGTVEKGCLSEAVYKVLKAVLWDVTKPFESTEIETLYREKILPEVPDEKYLLGSWEDLGDRTTGKYLQMLDRIQKIFGTCRIVYVLRNPLAQVPSEYLQNISGNFVRRNRKWMGSSASLDIDGWFEKKTHKSSSHGDVLNYNQNIQASIELLGKENVGVFLFESLMENPESYYRAISNFIGIDVDEAYTLSQQKHYNARITRGQLDLIMKLESSSWARRLLPYASSRWRLNLLRGTVKNTGSAKVDLTPELHEKIATATRDGHRWLVENLDLPLESHGYPL